jgi:hypothetical protein
VSSQPPAFPSPSPTSALTVFRLRRVNPQYLHILKAHVKASRVELKTFTQLTGAHYNPETCQWSLEVETMLPEGKISSDGARAAPREPVSETIDHVDYLVCSTGSKLDFARDFSLLRPSLGGSSEGLG